MSAAAAVCDSPAASRAVLISAGAGLAEGPFGPRFGWLDTAKSLLPAPHPVKAVIFNRSDRFVVDLKLGDAQLFDNGLNALMTRFGGEFFDEGAGFFAGGFVVKDFNEGFEDFGIGHFRLLAPVPEARLWRIHNLNNTRIACNCKNFLRKISEAETPPHNAKVSGGGTFPPSA